ncbi:hypothetical protein Bca52824_074936 [Brassica carinata]|uniref:Uncharacterized protein n=1 Tax=Brassica carinata TaxID=52824 RepID=A0A8X7PRW5_BRACI|nr:hypothetical protein Bca52824_074936 [Brassica carinata]
MRTYPIDHPHRLGKLSHFAGSTLGGRKVEFEQPFEIKLLASDSTSLTLKIVLEYVVRRKLPVNHVFIHHRMFVLARLEPISLRPSHIWNKPIHVRLKPGTVERNNATDPLRGEVREIILGQ